MDRPLALTCEMAAELTPLGINRIRYLANTDPTFPAFKNGKGIVIPTRAFEDWLCAQAAERLGFAVANTPQVSVRRRRVS